MPKQVAAELRCELPFCECEALPPLRCEHKFCSGCMLGLVKMTHPELAMLGIACPICRRKSVIGEVTFAMLMRRHRPKGTMLMDFSDTKAGFCLAMQDRAKRSEKEQVKEAHFFFLRTTYYLKYLTLRQLAEWDMVALFEELSRRSQTRRDAIWLLADMPFEAPPFKLLMSEVDAVALRGAGLSGEERGAERENVATI